MYNRKIDGCKNDPENSSAIKVGKHILSGFSMSTISSFRSIENKHYVYTGKDCMNKFCESLTEHAKKKINFLKKEIICREKFEDECLKDKEYHKVRDHCHYTWEYRGAALSICNLKYS